MAEPGRWRRRVGQVFDGLARSDPYEAATSGADGAGDGDADDDLTVAQIGELYRWPCTQCAMRFATPQAAAFHEWQAHKRACSFRACAIGTA